MDSDKEYVEVFEDEGGAQDKRGRPAQLRRYKDDAYRSALSTHTRMHACILHAYCQSVQRQTRICILHHVSLTFQSMPDCNSIAHALPCGVHDTLSKACLLQDTFHGATSSPMHCTHTL